MLRVVVLLLALLWSDSAFAPTAPSCCSPEGPEEFVGPFANWLNVQTKCGATGNGTTNDARAIQTCINDLTAANPVLYFPPPSICYNITSKLTIAAHSYYTLVGASPATTPICWGGISGGTMLYVNGMAYGMVGRLTFNGKTKASILINQSWDGSTGAFDTQNQYPDVVLENGGTGFQCGALGQGCAETVMLRNTFSTLTTAGVAMGNQNALDMFVWYSNFVNDYAGVQNTLGAGGFHVFESNFSGSTYADLTFAATEGFDFRWNYSIGSSTFLYSGFNGGNPCAINLQGNVILDYTGGSHAIAIGCNGPMNLIDNTVRTLSANTTQPVYNQIAGTSIFSVGNTFTVPNPLGTASPGEIISTDDVVVPRSAINPTAPTLPPVPPNNNRVITEVSPGASSATIQTDITNACNSGNTRPVVHLQAASYTRVSVTIPANCDVQVIGDGPYVTQLVGTGSAPTLTFVGPNFATLRNVFVNGNGGVGIYTSGIDQVGARLFMESVEVDSNTVNVLFNGLANLQVEAHDFFEAAAGTISVNVVGPTGVWQGSQFSVFAGAASADPTSYQVSNGGHLMVEDSWFDTGGGGIQRLNIPGGGGAVSFSGGQSNMNAGSLPSFAVANFSGNFALLGQEIVGDNIVISGSGAGSNDLIAGNALLSGVKISNTATGETYAFLVNMNSFSTYEPDTANYENQSFLLTTLSQMRGSLPTIPGSPLLPAGATDLRMYRVQVWGSSTGISINP
jgi:hypothetical protein